MKPPLPRGRVPHHPILRLVLAAAGLALVAGVASRVEWHQLRQGVRGLRWPLLGAGVLLAAGAISLRALRLALVLRTPRRYAPVWRSVVMGYAGTLVLPLGGGEVAKIASLEALVGAPRMAAAAGVVLDRTLDVLGLGGLLAALAILGVALDLRRGPLLAGAAILVALGVAGVVALRAPASLGRHPSWIVRKLMEAGDALAPLKDVRLLANVLALQAAITLLDVVGLFTSLHAFGFAGRVTFPVSMKLSAYMMLGAALPLLPGGLGTGQVASMLALVPAGASPGEAFAFSLVAQGATACLIGLLALLAVVWPSARPEH